VNKKDVAPYGATFEAESGRQVLIKY